MKENLKKDLSYRIIISVGLVFLCITSHLTTSCVSVSFDTLFPVTWYEKGMRSLLFVWHELKGPQVCTQLCIDICLSKLTFARCCIERIAKEGERILQEDRDYCRMVLDKVRLLIIEHTAVTDKNAFHPHSFKKGSVDADYLYCFDNLIHLIDSAIAQPSTITP